MTEKEFYTPGEAAKVLGCEAWQVRRQYELGRIEERGRFNGVRMIHVDDLPVLKGLIALMRDRGSKKIGRPTADKSHLQLMEPDASGKIKLEPLPKP